MTSTGIPPRYAIRQVGATWTVYNWHDLEPARVGDAQQIGLDRDVAAAVADRLNLAILCERGQRSEPRSAPAPSRRLTVVSDVEAA